MLANAQFPRFRVNIRVNRPISTHINRSSDCHRFLSDDRYVFLVKGSLQVLSDNLEVLRENGGSDQRYAALTISRHAEA